MRTEKDKLGAMELDDNVLYGIQTARAAKNFDLKHKKAQMRLINAIVLVKKAAALTYIKMEIGKDNVYPAIVKACDISLRAAQMKLLSQSLCRAVPALPPT